MTIEKVPQGALRLRSSGAQACAFAKDGEETPQLQMVAYSGGVISDHYYWGNLVIDLSGMKFSKKKYPVLEDHWTAKKIAFTGKPVIEDNKLSLDPAKTTFVDTPESEEFQKLSKEGFPYESSIYAEPSVIESIEEGASVEVNGFTLKGPARVWRQCEFKEASVCVFGYDDKTSSQAFSKEVVELSVEETVVSIEGKVNNPKEVKKNMNLAQLQKDHPELVTEIEGAITTTLTADFDTKLAAQKAEADTQKTGLETQMSALNDRLLESEKQETLRTERETKLRADGIWTNKLSESEVPVHLHDKVRLHVVHSKFTKDGVTDWEKFSEAVGVEVTSWEESGVTTTVMGSGLGGETRELETGKKDAEKLSKENTEQSDRMLKLAGQPQKEATT